MLIGCRSSGMSFVEFLLVLLLFLVVVKCASDLPIGESAQKSLAQSLIKKDLLAQGHLNGFDYYPDISLVYPVKGGLSLSVERDIIASRCNGHLDFKYHHVRDGQIVSKSKFVTDALTAFNACVLRQYNELEISSSTLNDILIDKSYKRYANNKVVRRLINKIKKDDFISVAEYFELRLLIYLVNKRMYTLDVKRKLGGF